MRSSPTISYPTTSRNNRSQQSLTTEIPGSFQWIGKVTVGLVVFGLAARRSPVPRRRAVSRGTLLPAPVALVVGWLTPVVDDERGLLQRVLEVLLLGWLLAIGARAPRASGVGRDGHAAHAGRGLPGGPLEADRGQAAGDEVEVVEDQGTDGGQGLGDAAGPVG
jgi:hypothetical protein